MSYKISLFDLNYGREEEEAAIKTLRSKWISMGTNVADLEKEAARIFGVKHVIAVTNCTAALHLALKILGIKEDDEVIVPSLTFVATVNAVFYVGAKPVFADITSREDFSISPADITKKITPRTKAIIVMHYGGFPCDMDAILEIARTYNVRVVEDAAHAPGAEFRGKKMGTIGDFGCFSFFSNKNITCAEGGLLTTNDDGFAEQAKLLRAHGMTTLSYDRAQGHATEYDVVALGYNYRLDDIRGSLALVQLKKLEGDIRRREELREYYINNLKNQDNIGLPYENNVHKSTNYIFPVLLKNSNVGKRNRIRKYLSDSGIQTSVHYPAVHQFSIYRQYKTELMNTEYVSENEITLPMYYSLQFHEIDYICSRLKEAGKNSYAGIK